MTDHQPTVRVSNVQLAQLKAIFKSTGGRIGLDDIVNFNQLQLGSLKRRGFIAETRNKEGLVITEAGRQAVISFERADFFRKVASSRLSCFLDLHAIDSHKSIRRSTATHKELHVIMGRKKVS